MVSILSYWFQRVLYWDKFSRGEIFANSKIREIFLFREDLISRIWSWPIFREDLISRFWDFFKSLRAHSFTFQPHKELISRISQFLIFREDLFSRMGAKSIFHGRNFREFLEKKSRNCKNSRKVLPRKFKVKVK